MSFIFLFWFALEVFAIIQMSLFLTQFVEFRTKGEGSVQPDPSTFVWEHLELGSGDVSIKVIWMPAVDGATGMNFFVKYRIKSESSWILTHHEEVNDFVIVRQLLPSQLYEMVMVSIDGEFSAESQIQEIKTKEIGIKNNIELKIIRKRF